MPGTTNEHMDVVVMTIAVLDQALTGAFGSRVAEGLKQAFLAIAAAPGLEIQGWLKVTIEEDLEDFATVDQALQEGPGPARVNILDANAPQAIERSATAHIEPDVGFAPRLVTSVRWKSASTSSRKVADDKAVRSLVTLPHQATTLLGEVDHAPGTPGIVREAQLERTRVIQFRGIDEAASVGRTDGLLDGFPLGEGRHGVADHCCADRETTQHDQRCQRLEAIA